jgi:hypothetical protein
MKRRIEIDVETERTVEEFVEAAVWCQQCREYVVAVSLDAAVSLARVSAGAVLYWIAAKQVHSLDSRGLLRVCEKSLVESAASF